MQMPVTGEHYVPEVRGQVYYEHVHRYAHGALCDAELHAYEECA